MGEGGGGGERAESDDGTAPLGCRQERAKAAMQSPVPMASCLISNVQCV